MNEEGDDGIYTMVINLPAYQQMGSILNARALEPEP